MGKYDSVFEQLSRTNCVRKPRFACILIFYVYNLFFSDASKSISTRTFYKTRTKSTQIEHLIAHVTCNSDEESDKPDDE